MTTLQYGLNITKNTLIAQTQVLDTIAHNVANANTPGFSRQRVILESIPDGGSKLSTKLLIGGGVEASQVQRSRSSLYDEIFRNENKNLYAYKETENLMHQVELLFDEPSDRGLGSVINDFFNSWSDVANDPLNMASRENSYSLSTEMTDRFHRIFGQLETMQGDIDNEISGLPASLNEISGEIANLNKSIRLAGIQKHGGNDLRDKRDILIDELSQFIDTRSVEHDNGTVTILIGNNIVVDGENYTELKAVTQSSLKENTKRTAIVSEDGNEYFPTKGKLGALLNFRDEVIQQISDYLNKITDSIVTYVNFEHKSGYGLDGITGRNFFDPNRTMAYNIELSPDVKDVSYIAVSADGTKGNNENAIKISELSEAQIIDQGFSIGEYYNSLISKIGIMGRDAQSNRKNEELLVSQIDNAREGIKGVSIDEELIQMIQTQHIYQGAARMITVFDELLETVVSLT